MANTGTRPPLFDPEPGSFDDDVPEPRFPRRPSGRGSSGARSTTTSSPAWVRPFIFGGLVLVALISVIGVLGGDDEPSVTPVAVSPTPVSEAAASAQPSPASSGAATATASELPSAAPAPATADPAVDADADPAADVEPVPAEPTPVLVFSPAMQRATAFAVQFAHDYLNYDQANPEVRQRDLRVYLAPGLDPQLGWNGQGSQVAVLTVPVEARETPDGAVVVVAAQVTGRDAPRWVHLAVDLTRDDQGRLAVTGPPAYVPRPQPGVPAQPPPEAVDQTLSDQLQAGMQPLFAAYAADPGVVVPGVTLDGAAIRGLGGQVALAAVGPLRVFAGDDSIRDAAIEVSWVDEITGGTIAQAYTLELTSSPSGWLVSAVSAG